MWTQSGPNQGSAAASADEDGERGLLAVPRGARIARRAAERVGDGAQSASTGRARALKASTTSAIAIGSTSR